MGTDQNSYDVVIPYRTSYPDTELFFALQSLNNTPHRDVYLVGDKPNWYEGKHLPIENYKWVIHRPVHNVENKIRAACESPAVSENFILTNDDFFIMKPTDIKPFNRGLLIDHINARRRNDLYSKSLRQTYEVLTRLGIKSPLSFELHIPMVLNKHLRLQLSYDMEKYFDKRHSLLMRSIYGNLHVKDSEYIADCKNVKDFQDATYLSTNESTFNGPIGEYIQLMLS